MMYMDMEREVLMRKMKPEKQEKYFTLTQWNEYRNGITDGELVPMLTQ